MSQKFEKNYCWDASDRESSGSGAKGLYRGRGDPHGDEALPPTLGALRALTSVLTSLVTAEGIIGNLDELRTSKKY